MEQIGFFKSVEMTPTEFEQEVAKCLKASGISINSIVRHNVKLPGSDGVYQIDVLAEFEALGGKFRVLVECKHQKNPIKREVVQILLQKVHSTGSQKGMIFATTSFQKGALEFANAHGIALVQVTSGEYSYETRSRDGHATPPPWVHIPKYNLYLITMAENGNSIIRSLLYGGSRSLMDSMVDIK